MSVATMKRQLMTHYLTQYRGKCIKNYIQRLRVKNVFNSTVEQQNLYIKYTFSQKNIKS